MNLPAAMSVSTDILNYVNSKIPIAQGAAFYAFLEERETNANTNFEKRGVSFESALKQTVDDFVMLDPNMKTELAMLNPRTMQNWLVGLNHSAASPLTLEETEATPLLEPEPEPEPEPLPPLPELPSPELHPQQPQTGEDMDTENLLVPLDPSEAGFRGDLLHREWRRAGNEARVL